MEAVCIMKGVKPARVKNKDGKMGDDYWESAKKMLMDSKFLDSLKAYDKDNIKPKIIKKIRPYLKKKEFELKVVKKASKAAYGLCSWVRAMEAYDRVAKVVGPKRVTLAAAEADLEEVMNQLKEKQDALQAVVDKIQALNDDLAAKKAYSDQLESDVELCKVKLERAEKLIGGLAGEKVRWTAASKQLVIDYAALTGDALLVRMHRVPRRVQRDVPRGDHRRLGKDVPREGHRVRSQVLAGEGAGRSGEDSRVEHPGFAQG